MITVSGRALAHPLWWGALAVLVLNDHVLKGSPGLGWLTGKLSDFAGLIVAPVLAAALVRARGDAQRAAAFGAVLVPFVAIKLSPAAAEVLTELMLQAGVRWRVWTDPTDLVALTVLPLAWRMSSGRLAPEPLPSTVVERVGVFIGALACVATSSEVIEFQTRAYLVNMTESDVTVDVYRPSAPLDCAAMEADLEASLTPDLFGFDKCRAVESFGVLPLDHDWRSDFDDNPDQRPPRACDAVVVRVAGAPDTVIYWGDLPQRELRVGVTFGAAAAVDDERSVLLERGGDERFLSPGADLQAWAVDWSLPPRSGACPRAP